MFGDFNIVIDVRSIAIFSAYLLILLLLWQAQRNSTVNWVDMISSSPDKVSLTKFLQLVGGITGTWIMVIITLNGHLTTELLSVYLAYVGAIEGWSKYVTARYGGGSRNSQSPDPNTKR